MTIITTPKTITVGESLIKYIDETGYGIEVVLFDLYVHPSERGEYLGHALIKAAIKDIIRHGYSKIFIVTERSLIRYYEKAGFVVTDNQLGEMYWNRRNA